MKQIRFYIIELILAGCLVVAVSFFGYLGYGLLWLNRSPNFSGEQALEYVNNQVKFGPRIAGSKRSEKMRNWLETSLSREGWDVITQPFVVPIRGTASLLNIEGDFSSVPEETQDDPVRPTESQVLGHNLIAIRDPFHDEDETSKKQYPVILLITAYDSRHWDDVLPSGARQPILGANSGASGTAVLLELAHTLHMKNVGHTVCLAFLDNEANVGLDGWGVDARIRSGSRYLLDRLDQELSRCASPQAVIAVDTVGYADQQIFLDGNSTTQLSQSIWQVAAKLGYGKWIVDQTAEQPPYIHTPFQEAGIPTTLMMDFGYRYRYTASDTFDKVSAQSLGRVGRTLEVWLEQRAPEEKNETINPLVDFLNMLQRMIKNYTN